MEAETAVNIEESDIMEEVKLSDVELEKQPMTGDGQAASGEKNGSIKIKIPEEEHTFTGLTKEELLKVAGTPGWVRIRWFLLILFWLGWLGMLGAAILLIIRAPSCKPIPKMKWWNEGPIYQITDLETFSGGFKGLEEKVNALADLKIKAVVIGPIHTVQKDQPTTLDFKKINPTFGTQDELVSLLAAADKQNLYVILDLSPNFPGPSSWFENNEETMGKLKEAAAYWRELGVDGFKIPNLRIATNFSSWSAIRDIIQAGRDEAYGTPRLLMGVVEGMTASNVLSMANNSEADLILTDLLSTKTSGKERLQAVEQLKNIQKNISWGFGASSKKHLSTLAPGLSRLYHLLLFTLPGTPVFTYGDEIGLKANGSQPVKMDWTIGEKTKAENKTASADSEERLALRKWFKSLCELRGKERSLLYGDLYSLYSSDTAVSFLRVWDQSDRYITAVNWGTSEETLKLAQNVSADVALPKEATVKLSSNEKIAVDSKVPLTQIKLQPGDALLLQFPL